MLKMIGSGVAMFGALLIADVLMKIVGQPLLASIPSGAWGLEWLAASVAWLGTAEALFWWLLAGILLLALLAWRSSWLTQTSSVVSTIMLTAGALAGVAFRLTHAEMIPSNLAADPAFWFLVIGALAPFVLWALRRPTDVAIDAIFDSLENRQERRDRKDRCEPNLMKQTSSPVAPPANT